MIFDGPTTLYTATQLRWLQDGYKKLRIFSNAPRSILYSNPLRFVDNSAVYEAEVTIVEGK